MSVNIYSTATSALTMVKSVGGCICEESLDTAGANRALYLAEKYRLPEIITRILVARAVPEEQILSFLDPKLRDLLPDPLVIKDMDLFGDRLAAAVKCRESVAIFGDYDVDGVCSSSLLSKFLAFFSVPHEVYIPDRLTEGYGPNELALEKLVQRGHKLVILVDCGSSNLDMLQKIKKMGVDIAILDHHQIAGDIPSDLIVINPNRADDFSLLGYLCAAGVVFLGLVQTLRVLRTVLPQPLPDLRNLLDLVALATVCDIVPMRGVNRLFIVSGLKVMHSLHNKGLAALAKVANIREPITVSHCGFALGPRINAGGRLEDALQAFKLLTTTSDEEAHQLAVALDALNRERQALQKEMLEQALADLPQEDLVYDSACVVAKKGWHVGLVGLLAARLKEKLGVPAIAIAFDETGRGVGSARSIAGINLGKLIREAVELELLEKGGGHAMAAGLSIREEKVIDFTAWFKKRVDPSLRSLLDKKSLAIDGYLSASGATLSLLEQIKAAGPYGPYHEKPVFLFPAHLLTHVQLLSNDHLMLFIQDSYKRKLKLMAFASLPAQIRQFLLKNQGEKLHFVCHLEINHYQGRKNVVGYLVDVVPMN